MEKEAKDDETEDGNKEEKNTTPMHHDMKGPMGLPSVAGMVLIATFLFVVTILGWVTYNKINKYTFQALLSGMEKTSTTLPLLIVTIFIFIGIMSLSYVYRKMLFRVWIPLFLVAAIGVATSIFVLVLLTKVQNYANSGTINVAHVEKLQEAARNIAFFYTGVFALVCILLLIRHRRALHEKNFVEGKISDVPISEIDKEIFKIEKETKKAEEVAIQETVRVEKEKLRLEAEIKRMQALSNANVDKTELIERQKEVTRLRDEKKAIDDTARIQLRKVQAEAKVTELRRVNDVKNKKIQRQAELAEERVLREKILLEDKQKAAEILINSELRVAASRDATVRLYLAAAIRNAPIVNNEVNNLFLALLSTS
jgi:hypothetical protein